MGLLDRGQAALVRRLSDSSGAAVGALPVTYTRGAESASVAGAWPGIATYQRDSAEPGQSIAFAERDYLIPIPALLLGGFPVTPQRGDRISDPNIPDPVTGLPTVFELMTPNGEPVWRFSDQHGRTVYRVHTKRVS